MVAENESLDVIKVIRSLLVKHNAPYDYYIQYAEKFALDLQRALGGSADFNAIIATMLDKDEIIALSKTENGRHLEPYIYRDDLHFPALISSCGSLLHLYYKQGLKFSLFLASVNKRAEKSKTTRVLPITSKPTRSPAMSSLKVSIKQNNAIRRIELS